jgi:hypothetical protein
MKVLFNRFFAMAIILIAVQAFAIAVEYEKESFDDPYSYYYQPSTVVGVMDGQGATQIHPDYWGRMVFFTGEEPKVFQKRIKTRYKGYLPIIECTTTHGNVLYGIEGLGATLSGNPEDELMMFVKLWAKNETTKPQKATYWAGAVYESRKLINGYYQNEFNPNRSYTMENDLAIENGSVLYMYDAADVSAKFAGLGCPYNGKFTAAQAYIVPNSVNCLVRFDWTLQPGETRSTIVKVPNVIVNSNAAIVDQLRKASYDDYFKRTISFWEGLLTSGTEFQVPHAKTIGTLKTAFIDQLIAREKQGERYAQLVSRIQYPRTFFRDAIFTMRIYDLFGHPMITRKNIEYMQGTRFGNDSCAIHKDMDAALNPPLDDTRDLSKYPQKLWRYCDHFLMCDDMDYAREIMPEVKGLVTWIEKSIAADERGLMPRCTLCDNEFVGVDVPGIKENGHRSGDDFWAMAGLRTARLMAQRVNENELVAQIDRIIARFHPALLAEVDKAMRDAGYVPGTFDHGTSNRGDGWGEDRDNLMLVWPHETMDPYSPAVEASIERARSRYEWGVIGHYDGKENATFPYRSIWMMEAMVARGDQEMVVEDLYAQLAHTGSTHGSYEVAWKPRYGIEQHGWFNANYVSLIRNMLLREDWKGNLHLLSVVPAEWAQVGNKIGITRADTFYGPVSFTETILEDGAEIVISNEFRYSPESLVLHLPYFAKVSKVKVDGKSVSVKNNAVTLPVTARNVRLYWKTDPQKMAFTYDKYLAAFRKTLPPINIPIRSFYDIKERKDMWEMIAKQPWKIIGPFDDINQSGFETVYGPEKGFDSSAQYKGKSGDTVEWIDRAYLPAAYLPVDAVSTPWYRANFQTTETYTGVDFSSILKDSGVAYAYSNAWSAKAQKVTFSLGTDGPVVVWINGEKVHSYKKYRGWRAISPDNDKFEVQLNKGWNSVMVKVSRGGSPWGFTLRVLNADGKRINGIRFDADAQK